MNTQLPQSTDPKAKLEKTIAEWSQMQWLALMPCWLPGVLTAVRNTPTVPGREGYVLMFRAGMFIFGILAFIWVRWRIGRMKAQLAAMIEAESGPVAKPPIAAPE